jgi:hypothetical protein
MKNIQYINVWGIDGFIEHVKNGQGFVSVNKDSFLLVAKINDEVMYYGFEFESFSLKDVDYCLEQLVQYAKDNSIVILTNNDQGALSALDNTIKTMFSVYPDRDWAYFLAISVNDIFTLNGMYSLKMEQIKIMSKEKKSLSLMMSDVAKTFFGI